MSIDSVNGTVIRDTDMVGLDPDELSVFLVRLVNTQVSLALPSL